MRDSPTGVQTTVRVQPSSSDQGNSACVHDAILVSLNYTGSYFRRIFQIFDHILNRNKVTYFELKIQMRETKLVILFLFNMCFLNNLMVFMDDKANI